MRRWGIVLLAVLAIGLTGTAAFAEGKLKRPPDVELDPDRGMTFGRLPKTGFDGRMYSPLKQALRSRAMDPQIDPYNSVLKTNRYEPATGKIHDSLTDKVREMRRREELSRKNSDDEKQSPAASSSSPLKKRNAD